jgi:membrane protein DedA with SNARE-associated domain
MIAQLSEEILPIWGYLAIAVGAFIEGEAVLISAGTLAQRGALSMPWVVLAGCAGSLAWSQCWFQVGRHLGSGLIQRRPTWRARIGALESWLNRNATVFVLGFRFVAGMGTVAPAFLGAIRYPTRRFVGFDIPGAVLWSLAYSSAGSWLASALGVLLGRPSRLPELIGSVAGLVILVTLLAQALRWWLTHRAPTEPLVPPET